MAHVTLEGTITPSTFLGRGARLTVERTPYIDKLIRRGFVRVVTESATGTGATVDTARAVVAAQAAQDEPAAPTDAPTREPGRNASTEDWSEFMRAQGFDVAADASRADLIDAWDARDTTTADG